MLLEIKKLSVRVKSSGLKAVDGIDLSVDAGEPLLILGQSGSGGSISASGIIFTATGTVFTKICPSLE